MKPSTAGPSSPAPVDADLAEMAHPGHGIPSQDPASAAQFPLPRSEAEREARSVLAGGTMAAGAAAGTAIGVAVAGPVGGVIGGSLGAVAGALGGAAAGSIAEAARTDTGPGVQLHIDDSGGSGRPVVLIHGWPLSARSWEPQMAALLAAGHRVVAYDRRGFGQSGKPASDYGYDTLADDLQRVLERCELHSVTLVGFSMGGGEVARYIARHGPARLHSVVLAAAVTPCLMKSANNPDGPLDPKEAQLKRAALEQDRDAFFDTFTQAFYSANGVLMVSESQRQAAIALCQQSAPHAALACMDAFAHTDFRDDLAQLSLPTLVIHGDADAIVPIKGSGLPTHRLVPHSQLVRLPGAPHGLNLSHAQAFNEALLAFLRS